jgi:hypothetical protein
VKGLESRLWRDEGLDVLFSEAFQGTVRQFAEFATRSAMMLGIPSASSAWIEIE